MNLDFAKSFGFKDNESLIKGIIYINYFELLCYLLFISFTIYCSYLIFLTIKNRYNYYMIIVIFIISSFIGYLLNENDNIYLVKDKLSFNEYFNTNHKVYINIFNTDLGIKIMLNKAFIFQMFFVSLITYYESIISVKLLSYETKKDINEVNEIFALSLCNLFSTVFGFLIYSIPMGKNIIPYKLNPKNKNFLLYSMLFTTVICYLFWNYFQNIPIYTLQLFNMSIFFLMIDVKEIKAYYKYNKLYGVSIIIILFFYYYYDILYSLSIGLLVILLIYLTNKKTFQVNTYDNTYFNYSDILLKDSEENFLFNDDEDNNFLTKNNSKIYKLKGKFNFLFLNKHFLNLTLLKNYIIILDIEDIIKIDIEFLSEYNNFFNKLNYFNFKYFVYGIKSEEIKNNLFLDVYWINMLLQNNKIIKYNYNNKKVK